MHDSGVSATLGHCKPTGLHDVASGTEVAVLVGLLAFNV